MPVVDVPVGNLDNESDLMDWLANELVTNHHFTEERRTGDIIGNDIILVLERISAETFHGDSDMTLLLDKGSHSETSTISAFQFNLSHLDYSGTVETTTPAAITVDFVLAGPGNEIRVLSGAFTDWTAAGYSAGQYVRVTNAATAGNNGLYEITAISTTSTTDDTLELREIANGGIKDLVAGDLSDAITVVEEANQVSLFQGVFNGEDSETIGWNSGMDQMGAGSYLRARLITSEDSDLASPTVPLYFILIVEISTGVYRQMSFGEVVKLIPFIGGNYFSGCQFDAASDIDTAVLPWVQGYSISNVGEANRSGRAPGGVWSSDYTGAGIADVNGRGWLTFGSGGEQPFVNNPSHYHAAIFPHYRGSGKEVIGYSPSAFTGQSERWPLTIFGTFNIRNYEDVQSQHAPMAVIPDIFLADITNVDAYSVFQDQFGEKFMVVPVYTKNGSGVGSSEKWGYLIRNPDLVVT